MQHGKQATFNILAVKHLINAKIKPMLIFAFVNVVGGLWSLKSPFLGDGPDVIRISVLRHSKYQSYMSHSENECLSGSTYVPKM